MATKSEHRIDLDWIRVIGILVVFLYHTGRFFVLNSSWHVEDSLKSAWLRGFYGDFMEQWMMPLMFVVSGASIFYAMLSGRSAGRYAWDKVKRLLIPLIFGIFALAAIQVYLERLTHGDFSGSFWAFIPHLFEGLYGFGGNFPWMGLHLWYLLLLFLFSIIFLPLFLLLRSRPGQALIRAAAPALSFPGVILLLAVFAVPPLWISQDNPLGMTDIGGNNMVTYLVYLILGYLLFADERIWKSVIRYRWGILAFAVIVKVIDFNGVMGDVQRAFFSWAWILAIFGICMRYLTMRNPFIEYAAPAVLPFYMLHQTIIVTVGYVLIYALGWQLPIWAKYLIIGAVSFTVIMAIYEFIVRRYNVFRFLFGMKPLRRAQRAPELRPAPVK